MLPLTDTSRAKRPRVLVLGATGVFGGNLAKMLIEDGWEVTVTSRSRARAEAFAAAHGGQPLALDLDGGLAEAFASHGIVVDAAGPWQDYTGAPDPYRVARAAIEAKAHYLDLSDSADFTAGIGALDPAARAAGVGALSGASSVPALSSAAVTALSTGMARIETVETAILPGNRAPRGYSVMRAILGQVGAPMRLWRDGRWQEVRGWSEPRRYRLGAGPARKAALITVPDLALFPAHYRAETVEFRAGLELGLMQSSLAVISRLRGLGLFPDPARFTKPFHWLAARMERFGTDRGGMVVAVTGRLGNRLVRRRWTLIAEAGDGPYIPAIPALIAVGQVAAGGIAPGAHPALDVFTLDAAEQALSRLDTHFQHEEEEHG